MKRGHESVHLWEDCKFYCYVKSWVVAFFLYFFTFLCPFLLCLSNKCCRALSMIWSSNPSQWFAFTSFSVFYSCSTCFDSSSQRMNLFCFLFTSVSFLLSSTSHRTRTNSGALWTTIYYFMIFFYFAIFVYTSFRLATRKTFTIRMAFFATIMSSVTIIPEVLHLSFLFSLPHLLLLSSPA